MTSQRFLFVFVSLPLSLKTSPSRAGSLADLNPRVSWAAPFPFVVCSHVKNVQVSHDHPTFLFVPLSRWVVVLVAVHTLPPPHSVFSLHPCAFVRALLCCVAVFAQNRSQPHTPPLPPLFSVSLPHRTRRHNHQGTGKAAAKQQQEWTGSCGPWATSRASWSRASRSSSRNWNASMQVRCLFYGNGPTFLLCLLRRLQASVPLSMPARTRGAVVTEQQHHRQQQQDQTHWQTQTQLPWWCIWMCRRWS